MKLSSEIKHLLVGLMIPMFFFGGGFFLYFIKKMTEVDPLYHEDYLQEQEQEEREYLREEEAVIIEPIKLLNEEESEPEVVVIDPTLFQYIEVVDSCGHNFEGDCVRVRSGPGFDFPVINRLRNGQVLKVGGSVERDGIVWYRVVFDEWIRYPARVGGDWYVSADYVEILYDEGVKTLQSQSEVVSDKKILVLRSEQKLYAYEDDILFMEEFISTGLELTPTPRGEFKIFRKTPTRYMQGPLPGISYRYWDLPGVPWNLYFTHQGAVIHGTYWHDSFGRPWSNGCVNIHYNSARKLYNWAEPGTRVIVRD